VAGPLLAIEKCVAHQRFFLPPLFLVGNFLRLVFANSRNCFSLIDFAICFDGPLSDDFERFPRLAASAAPAAICCFFDFAGIQMFRAPNLKWIHPLKGSAHDPALTLRQKK